jgi:hypothetical protein
MASAEYRSRKRSLARKRKPFSGEAPASCCATHSASAPRRSGPSRLQFSCPYISAEYVSGIHATSAGSPGGPSRLSCVLCCTTSQPRVGGGRGGPLLRAAQDDAGWCAETAAARHRRPALHTAAQPGSLTVLPGCLLRDPQRAGPVSPLDVRVGPHVHGPRARRQARVLHRGHNARALVAEAALRSHQQLPARGARSAHVVVSPTRGVRTDIACRVQPRVLRSLVGRRTGGS